MANQVVQVPPDSTGKNVATYEKTEGGKTVQVQKVLLAGHGPDDDVLPITSAPTGSEYAPPVRNIPSGTQPVSIATLPLPAGAALEAGGNLESVAEALNEPARKMTDLLVQILAELRALRLGFARECADMRGDDLDPDEYRGGEEHVV